MAKIDNILGLCRADPNAFIEFVAGYEQADLHTEFQQILSRDQDVYGEWPRNHGKTDQLIYRIAWEIGHDPNLLVKVVKANDDEASDFCSAIRSIIESEKYRRVFPNIRKDTTEWGKTSLRVQRDLLSKDATVAASGIFGNPGGRADILVADDICTLKNAIQNPAQREQVKQAWTETWIPMLKTARSKQWNVCTPWHVSDITADWRKSKNFIVFRRPCHGTRSSPWPKNWPPARLLAMKEKIGNIAYARAYELVPLTGQEIVFPQDVLIQHQYFRNNLPTVGKVVACLDLAFTEKNQPRKTKKADPDWSVIMLGLITPSGEVFPFKCWRDQVTFPDFIKAWRAIADQYPIEIVTGDDNGPLKGINQQIQASVPGLNYRMLTRSTDKHSRAIEQQHKVLSGRFRLPCNEYGEVLGEFQAVLDEMSSFPVGSHDDTVDCAVDMLSLASTATPATSSTDNRINVYSTADIIDEGGKFEQQIIEMLEDGDPEVRDMFLRGG